MAQSGHIKICTLLFGLFLILFTIESNATNNNGELDSNKLKQDTIFMCDGHFFEWCNEESSCAHCNEALKPISLWGYYKKLECEDCKKFFEDNYPKFISGSKNIL